MQILHHQSIRDIPAAEWDALFDPAYPFARHDFLAALEDSGCVGRDAGWEPEHVTMRDETGALCGAAPHYRKHHSYGEFVFDFQWADAAYRIGCDYYPKGVCAIPFTPASGPRLGARDDRAREQLARTLYDAGKARQLSSEHVLFADAPDACALQNAGFLLREDVQFHFRNRGYTDFEDYLAALSSAKRKKIRRERRRVQEEADVQFRVVTGDSLDDAAWERIYALYARTYHVRGQSPYLTEAFWQQYGRSSGTPVRVVLAEHRGQILACALCVQGTDTSSAATGAAREDVHSLHFETCYYQGIEYCIQQGLARFDAGTQGGHKLMRGFEPVLTYSLHWLAEPRLHTAVADFLQRERAAVESGRDRLALEHSAYRQSESNTQDANAR